MAGQARALSVFHRDDSWRRGTTYVYLSTYVTTSKARVLLYSEVQYFSSSRSEESRKPIIETSILTFVNRLSLHRTSIMFQNPTAPCNPYPCSNNITHAVKTHTLRVSFSRKELLLRTVLWKLANPGSIKVEEKRHRHHDLGNMSERMQHRSEYAIATYHSEETQQRTLPIFDNPRVAKRFSNQRTQRVIKVPDSKVFYKTTQHLKLKGITRLLVDGNIYSLN